MMEWYFLLFAVGCFVFLCCTLSCKGRVVGIIWQFAGVVFLGLFAGTLSASMARYAIDKGITHITDLTGAHKVCSIPFYEDRLRSLPFALYTKPYSECIQDLKAGTCDAVVYDTLFLQHEFILDAAMAAKYKVIPGDDVQFVGPYFPFPSTAIAQSTEKSMYQNRINAALTELRAGGSTFRKGVKIYYPTADAAGQENTTAPKLNWYMCGSALGFIVVYWGICYFSDVKLSCTSELQTKEKKEKDTSSKVIVEMNTLQKPRTKLLDIAAATKLHDDADFLRRASFVKRDVELASSSKKKKGHAGHAGHLRTLFADGPEFIGLSNEVHSINGAMARLENMVATLMIMKQKEVKDGQVEKEVKEEVVFF